jgi:hypothetical protein
MWKRQDLKTVILFCPTLEDITSKSVNVCCAMLSKVSFRVFSALKQGSKMETMGMNLILPPDQVDYGPFDVREANTLHSIITKSSNGPFGT